MNEVLKQMSAHRSIRAYKQQAVSTKEIEQITTAARWASTSNHVQAYSIIVVQDDEKKKKLAELTGGQRWVEECPVFFVICCDFSRHKAASTEHQVSFDIGGAEQMLVGAVDAALVAQNMLLAAESLQLGGVMIGGIRNNPREVCELLTLPQHSFPVMGLAVGYPNQEVDQKPRLPQPAIVHMEEYNHEQDQYIQTYDTEMSQYYTERTNGKRTTGWTKAMAEYTKMRKRPHLDQYLKEQGFLHERHSEARMMQDGRDV